MVISTTPFPTRVYIDPPILISHHTRRSTPNTSPNHVHHNKSNLTTSTPNQHTKGHRPVLNQHNPRPQPARTAYPVPPRPRHGPSQTTPQPSTPPNPPTNPQEPPRRSPHPRRNSATPPSIHVLGPPKSPPATLYLWTAINSPSLYSSSIRQRGSSLLHDVRKPRMQLRDRTKHGAPRQQLQITLSTDHLCLLRLVARPAPNTGVPVVEHSARSGADWRCTPYGRSQQQQ